MSNFEMPAKENPELGLEHVLRLLKYDPVDSAYSAMDYLRKEEEMEEYHDAFVKKFSEENQEGNPEGKSPEEAARDDFFLHLKTADLKTQKRWLDVLMKKNYKEILEILDKKEQ